MRAFSIGARTVLMQGLAGLEVLAADRDALRGRQFDQRRDVGGQVGGTVGEGDPFQQGGVGVEHRGGDGPVVVAERRLEALEVGVALVLRHEDLGRGAPDHHEAVAIVRGLEVADVGADLLGQLHLPAAA